MIWAKWQQGERKWLILFSVVAASSLSLWGSVSDGRGQLCTAQDLALLMHNYLELPHMQENNRVWGEGKVQELNQAIKLWIFCWTRSVLSWERSKLEEAENLTPLPSSEGQWGCRDRELWLPQLNLTQTSRHGKHPSDLPHLRLSSHYLQPLSLIWEGEKSTWHLQMAVIQCSEGSLPPPALPSLGNSLCHNEITSAAE